jgi:NADPH2:quinone reductase
VFKTRQVGLLVLDRRYTDLSINAVVKQSSPTMKAIRFHAHGGPEVLHLEDVPMPQPKDGEALVRVTAAGVNYADIYQRTGITAVSLPHIPGLEGVGIIERPGGGVPQGQRVLWTPHPGAYAEFVAVPAWKLVPVPDDLDDAHALAAGMQALTAQFLTETTYPVKAGDDVLVHAGAGGVGLLLIQLLKHKGARVFTTVSTEEKAALVRDAGADEAILYTQTDFVSVVKAATGGKGVHVAYDSVGRTTSAGSLSLVRPLGTLVCFGQSSGVVPPIDPLALMKQGSVFLTRPTLAHFVADGPAVQHRAKRVFDWIKDGILKLRIGGSFPLAKAGDAQSALESRATTGKILLRVQD